MGKTSIEILEKTIASAAVAVGGGEIATVLSGAVRGKVGKVYTLASVSDLNRIFGESTGDDYAYCAYLLKRGCILKVVRTAVTTGDSPVKANALLPFAGVGANGLKATAVEYGQAFNGLKVIAKDLGGTGVDNLFSLTITDANNNLLEHFGIVSLNPLSAYYYGKTVKSEIIDLSIVGTWTNQTLFDPAAATPIVEQSVTLASATATTDPATLVTSLAPFEDLEVAFATLILPTRTPAQVATDTATLLAARSDFELLVDPQDSDTAESALTAFASNKNTNVAAFFPRLVLNEFDDCPPSVRMAELIADLHKRKLWFKAPAGLDYGLLPNVLDVRVPLNKKEIGDLQEACVNPIIVKTGHGVVCWGNSTLAPSVAEVRDLAVRLLTNYFKRTVYALSQRFIFADHNEFTWNQWKNSVEPVVRDVANIGGIRAYDIICDRSIMSEEDIANGIMRGQIIFWPVSHIEKIIITFGVDKSGVTFE